MRDITDIHGVSMKKQTLDDIRSILANASIELDAVDDTQAFARRLMALAQELEKSAVGLLRPQNGLSRKELAEEERLYARALEDYAGLQAQLAVVRQLLADENLFVRTLERKGSDLESMNVGLTFSGAMDMALQHLIHLMQYDIPDRNEVDIQNGFQFSSGSMNYQRFYFAPKGKRK